MIGVLMISMLVTLLNDIKQIADDATQNKELHELAKKVQRLPGYKDLVNHKHINSFQVLVASQPELLTGAYNFSRSAIQRRLEAGYEDTLKQV